MDFITTYVIQGKEMDVFQGEKSVVVAAPGNGNNWSCGKYATPEWLLERGLINRVDKANLDALSVVA